MQGKGIVKFFTIFLIIVSAYQLLLVLPTNSIDRAAKQYGEKMAQAAAPEKKDSVSIAYEQQYLDSAFRKTALNLGIVKFTYEDLKKQQIGLGLDLRGGMSATLQVDLKDLIVALSGGNSSPEFVQALNKASEMQTNSQKDYVTLFGEAYAQVTNGRPLAAAFAGNLSLKGKVDMDSPDATVLAYIRKEASETVQRTYELLKKRIDKFGVTSPNVTLDNNTDRITVELPGITSPGRAKTYLQASAKLEFWDMYTGGEIAGKLAELDEVLKTAATQNPGDTTNANDTTKTQPADTTLQDAAKGPLRNLCDGGDFFFQSPYGAACSVEASDTAKFMRMLNSTAGRRILPRDAKFLWDAKSTKDKSNNYTSKYVLYAIRMPPSKQTKLGGEHITEASSQVDEGGGNYVVNLSMDTEGSLIWKQMTTDNVKRPVAVVLDDKVYSAPTVNDVISGGSTRISGSFSASEAEDLANILKIGKLPARTEIIESAIVGPTLGAATIKAGLTSMLIALLVVMGFMMFYYSTAGVIAVIALLANLVFMLAALASLGTVLTLPGIAGIVLTMGMAVDANVVIYERVREEVREGKPLFNAIQDGFSHSYSALIDANLTTLLVAVVLAVMGLGPIKGFGVVLGIGVLSTMFTAILVSHLIFDWWTGKGRTVNFSIPATSNILVGKNIDFVSMRKYAYVFSIAVLVVGVASIFMRGFELGVDFTGGRGYTVAFEPGKPVDSDRLTATLAGVFKEGDKEMAPLVKQFDAINQVKITTSYMQTSVDPKADSLVREKLREGLAKFQGKDNLTQAEFDKMVLSESKVGATVADDIRNSALWTALVGLAGIFLYILIRFRRWQYSLGAVAATVHDMTIVITLFTLLHGLMPFSMEIDQAFIAAILTIIGYSVNDTVIVFDRLREYRNTYSHEPLSVVVNKAINSTLSRTIITALTVFFVAIVLFLFGGAGIKAFSFAMILGVGFGTYSSIFVATPIILDLMKDNAPEPVVTPPAVEEAPVASAKKPKA